MTLPTRVERLQPRRGVSLNELRGVVFPASDPSQFASATSVTFTVHGRQGWYLLALFVAGGLSNAFFGDGAGSSAEIAVVCLLIPALVVAGAFVRTWSRRGGSITLDNRDGQIIWRRPGDELAAGAWPLNTVRARPRLFSAFSDAVQLDCSGRCFVIRVPRRTSQLWASAITDAAARTDSGT